MKRFLLLSGVTIMALLLTVDTAPPKRVIGLGQRKCAKGAVEQEVCTNTGDPDQPVGLCLPYSHPHTIANYPQCPGSILDPQDGHGMDSRLICVPPIRCDAFLPTVYFGSWALTNASDSTYPAMVSLTCLHGYKLAGSSTVECRVNGTWEETTSECQPVYCGDPPLISINGTWIPEGNMTYGDVALLVCDTGYWDDSCSFIVCQADGNWSSSTASCTPVDCGFPPPITNGEFTLTSSTYLSVGAISCSDGFAPSDPDATVVCGADRRWSTPLATCERVECEDGWDKVGETCYIIERSGKMNFNTAIAYCVSLGGYLVAIETFTENALLKTYAIAESVDQWWIAITDEEIEGWWKFAESGANVTFFDWARNQPDNVRGVQHCGSMWFGNTGWQDATCRASLTVICEKSL